MAKAKAKKEVYQPVKMAKDELEAVLSRVTGLPTQAARDGLSAMINFITDRCVNWGDVIRIHGFGEFGPTLVRGREGVSSLPTAQGKEFKTGPKLKLKFTPAKGMFRMLSADEKKALEQ